MVLYVGARCPTEHMGAPVAKASELLEEVVGVVCALFVEDNSGEMSQQGPPQEGLTSRLKLTAGAAGWEA